jgi:hypothetical protein
MIIIIIIIIIIIGVIWGELCLLNVAVAAFVFILFRSCGLKVFVTPIYALVHYI